MGWYDEEHYREMRDREALESAQKEAFKAGSENRTYISPGLSPSDGLAVSASYNDGLHEYRKQQEANQTNNINSEYASSHRNYEPREAQPPLPFGPTQRLICWMALVLFIIGILMLVFDIR